LEFAGLENDRQHRRAEMEIAGLDNDRLEFNCVARFLATGNFPTSEAEARDEIMLFFCQNHVFLPIFTQKLQGTYLKHEKLH